MDYDAILLRSTWLLTAGSLPEQLAAAFALEELGAKAEPALSDLLAVLSFLDLEEIEPADCVHDLDPEDNPNYRYLVASAAIQAIESIGSSKAVSCLASFLSRCLKINGNEFHRTMAFNACHALAVIGPKASEALPTIIQAIEHPTEINTERWGKLMAAYAHWRITGSTEQALAVSKAMLDDPEWWFRCHAIDLLDIIQGVCQEANEALKAACNDPHEDVRGDAEKALAGKGPKKMLNTRLLFCCPDELEE